MPTATTNVHIDTLLTTAVAGYKNLDYQARNVLPILPAAKESGKIGKYGTEHYRLDFNERSMGAKASRIDWQATTPVTFSASEWTVEKPVDDREKALYDDPFNAMVDASLVCAEKIWLKMEDLVATLMNTTGNFGSNAAGSAWGTPGTGLPVTNIKTAVNNIVNRTGIGPRNLYGCCSFKVFTDMCANNEVKNLFLNTVPNRAGLAVLTTADIASAVGLADIYVFTAVKNTAVEGAADSFSNVYGTTTFAVFAKYPGPPNMMAPSFASIISPSVPGLPGANIAVDQYRDESVRSDVVRASALFDQIVVNSAMGHLITGLT